MSELDIIAQRARKILCGGEKDGGARYVDGVSLGGTAPALVREGTHAFYPDLDYSDKTVSLWQCRTHLGRLRSALAARGDEEPDGAFVADIIAAVDFWLDNDFTNPNWWHNQIGTPTDLSAVCLLLGDTIGEARLERCLAVISRGSFSHNPPILKWTGANLLWGVRNTVYYALLSRDGELLRAASERAAAELTVAEGLAEGIKPDRSFYQHGAQLYSCGYGRAFTADAAQLIYLLSGTEYSLPAEKIKLFESFVLDGQRYFTRGNAVDYLAVGRELARGGALSSSPFGGALDFMLSTAEYSRRGELEAFDKALETGKDAFSGTKYFENSYFLSHNRPGFHMGAKGAHADFIGTEWGNGENYLGYNLARGGNTCFMSDGLEYFDLAPVWNYSLLPGATAPALDDGALRALSGGGWASPRGKNRDCGGRSERGLGALHLRLEGGGVAGLLAYISFDGGMICLGCGITAPDGARTAVDQCLWRGELPRGVITLGRGESVANGGFKYFNLCDNKLFCETRDASGSWRRVNDASSSEPVTQTVTALYYNHRAGDTSDYAYAVLAADCDPGVITEIVNTPERQSAAFADGRSVIVTRGESGTEITII